MDKAPTKSWWRRGWMFPASLMLHVLVVGAFYMQWPQMNAAPVEPESVSVELVEPPKEEPPPPPEEKKAEEEKPAEPPPPEAKKEEPPPPPNMPNVAIRPDKTQLDERDQPAEQAEEGGAEQQQPGEMDASTPSPEPAQASADQKEQPKAQPVETQQKAEASASQMPPVADTGEIAASPTQADQDQIAVAVPLPKPEPEETKPQRPDAAVSGEGDPNLKPAKKILASGKRPRPMLRQIMGNLPPVQRVAQLCVAETMAQIKDSRGPYTGLQPHTGRDFPVSGNVMNAKGAFNLGNQWYSIDYRCEVDIDKYIVTDFRFHIGNQLSREDIKRLKLPEG